MSVDNTGSSFSDDLLGVIMLQVESKFFSDRLWRILPGKATGQSLVSSALHNCDWDHQDHPFSMSSFWSSSIKSASFPGAALACKSFGSRVKEHCEISSSDCVRGSCQATRRSMLSSFLGKSFLMNAKPEMWPCGMSQRVELHSKSRRHKPLVLPVVVVVGVVVVLVVVQGSYDDCWKRIVQSVCSLPAPEQPAPRWQSSARPCIWFFSQRSWFGP